MLNKQVYTLVAQTTLILSKFAWKKGRWNKPTVMGQTSLAYQEKSHKLLLIVSTYERDIDIYAFLWTS